MIDAMPKLGNHFATLAAALGIWSSAETEAIVKTALGHAQLALEPSTQDSGSLAAE